MRTVWGVLALLVVATAATVVIRAGMPSSATRLPGAVIVPAATTPARPPESTSAGAGADASLGTGRPVNVVTPERPVSSLPAPSGSDSREAEQVKTGGQPATTPSTSAPSDR